MDKEIIDSQVNNNCEQYGCFKKANTNTNSKPSSDAVTEATARSIHHIADHSTEYQICLDGAIPDSIKKDNDVMMCCPDRICSECGNDHSFRGNFEGVITIINWNENGRT
jgi:hypothetical protein